jgi:tetraacyldisaccharide 4'-kinase
MNIFEKIYLFFYLKKKFKAIKNQKKLPFPVISIGNINLGGTGKTPFTIALAKEALQRGYEPIILTRGYRGRSKGPLFVTKENSAEEVGDEPLLMAEEGLKVVKSIDRYKGGIYATQNLNLTSSNRVLFLLDDGFQHWQLYRNLDIILVDGMRDKPFGNYHLLPFGSLRSPLTELFDGDMIFITKKRNEFLYKKFKELGLKKVSFAPFKIEGIRNYEGKKIEPEGQKVFAFAGIGSFESFINCLRELKLEIGEYRKFIDHKTYSEKLLKKLYRMSKDFDLIITTKKDFIKIKDKASIFGEKLCYLDISIEIAKEDFEEIFQKISTKHIDII